jgi:hypothetical protein
VFKRVLAKEKAHLKDNLDLAKSGLLDFLSSSDVRILRKREREKVDAETLPSK